MGTITSNIQKFFVSWLEAFQIELHTFWDMQNANSIFYRFLAIFSAVFWPIDWFKKNVGLNLEYFSHLKLLPFSAFLHCSYIKIEKRNTPTLTLNISGSLRVIKMHFTILNGWNTQDLAQRRPRKWPKTNKKYHYLPISQKYMLIRNIYSPERY